MTQGQGRELVVGAIVIAAVVVVAVGTLWLKGTNFGVEQTSVDVLVADVGQLTKGNSVKLRGVKIGSVGSVEVEPGGQVVRIGLDLDGDFAIEDPQDAGVIIAPESLFGDWQAEIVTRSRFPQFGYYQPRPGDQHGDTLVLGGYAIPDISRLTAAADEISQNLATLTNRFDRAFSEETADQLRGAIGNLEAVSNDIREMISQQATTFQGVSTDVARAANEISQASTQARVTLQEIDVMLNRGDVDSILVNVARASSSIDQIVARVNTSTEGLPQTIAKADSAFGSVQRVTARIESGQGSLGRLLVDSTLAVRSELAIARFLDEWLAKQS
jgi:phospholipid/cholesterol/gamma-HCH transport system substrate-binding protein